MLSDFAPYPHSSVFLGRSFLCGFLLQCALFFNLTATILVLLPTQTMAQVPNGTRNFTIPLDSSAIIYTPFRCGRNTTVSTSNQCEGGWLTERVGGNTTVSTTGPSNAAGEIIPQMFFQFRGSALYLITTETSNARVNITVTTNGTIISAVFDTTLGSASILNLVASTVTTFALTFLPSNVMTEFELTSLILTVPNGALVTTLPVLPSMTLPPSSSPPIFTPTPTAPASPTAALPPPSTSQPNPDTSSAHHSNVAIAVGITLGLGLGLTSVAAVGYMWYKKQRQLRTRSPMTAQATDQIRNGYDPGGSGSARNVSWSNFHATENSGIIEIGRFTGSNPGAGAGGHSEPIGGGIGGGGGVVNGRPSKIGNSGWGSNNG